MEEIKEVNKTNTEPEKDTRLELLKETIKAALAEINLILVKYKLEFAVIHKLAINPELKQEEIVHEIVLKPTK